MIHARYVTQTWERIRTTSDTINRRRFLGAVGLGSAAAFLAACSRGQQPGGTPATSAPVDTSWLPQPTLAATTPVNGQFQLPPLPYSYNALEPHIDAATMQIHHDRHHQGYVNNLNAALQGHPDWQNRNVVELLTSLEQIPEEIRTNVRQNGGGHLNHSIFWEIMMPGGGGAPTGDLANAINTAFGSFAAMQEQFNSTATSVFGSGWGWLALDQQGQLRIVKTANQDSPYSEGLYPLMGVDVWEHSYYLKYQNKRAEYVNAWWNTLNWQMISQRYALGVSAAG
jgi:Fe-Mn family superoxide dismutase